MDFALRDDALARAARIAELDARAAEVRDEASRLRGRIEATVWPEQPRPELLRQVNAIQVLHEAGDRAALRRALALLVESVVLRVDPETGAIVARLNLYRTDAEEKGFEPPGRFRPTVFKTAAFNHSATPPGR